MATECTATTPPVVLSHPILRIFESAGWSAFDGQPLYKYSDVRWVLETSTPAIKQLLVSCPYRHGRRRHVVCDVKIGWLAAGQMPCIPHWHTDCTMDRDHPGSPEIHYLYITGAGSRTQFRWCAPDSHFVAHMRIPTDAWVTYSREHEHRCTPATESGYRLLVRVTETDIIKPKNNKIGTFEFKEDRYVRWK